MKISFTIAMLLLVACNQKDSNNAQSPHADNPCSIEKDTIITTSLFAIPQDSLLMKKFVSAMQIIESDGVMELKKPFKVDVWENITLPHYIDTCENRHLVQLFVLKNVRAIQCSFVSHTALKGTKDYYPRFELTQWNFANNADRDSAFKIKEWVYTHGGTEYEYRYNQTIKGDHCLFLIEPNAKIFEQTAIEYADLLRKHLSDNPN